MTIDGCKVARLQGCKVARLQGCRLQVASCKLQVASCRFQVAGCKCKHIVQITSYEKFFVTYLLNINISKDIEVIDSLQLRKLKSAMADMIVIYRSLGEIIDYLEKNPQSY